MLKLPRIKRRAFSVYWVRAGVAGFLVSFLLSFMSPVSAQRLVIADVQGDWGLLAPFLHAARGPGYVYTSFVFDSLLWKDTDGQIQPLLATDWQYHADEQCYVFALHPEAQWHDGRPLTATDVIFSFRYLKEHHYRFVDLGSVVAVTAHARATGGEEVSVCLDHPSASFLTNVAASLPIIPEHVYAAVSDPSRFAYQAAAMGSGPYQLVEYNRAQGSYRLVAHIDHHLGAPAYDEVLLIRMTPQAARLAMQREGLDATTLSHQQVLPFQEAGWTVLSQASNHPVRLLFNHQQLFATTQARQGIAYLLNRQTLADIAYQGQAQAARIGYRQDIEDQLSRVYPMDQDQANVHLVAAGWQQDTRGRWLNSDKEPLVLRLVAQASLDSVAQLLAYQLESAGFSVMLRLEQDVQLNQRLRTGEYDLALLSASHEGDPDRFRLMITGQQQRGDYYLDHPELLALLDEQRFVLDPEQRERLILQAEKLYSELLPSLPLVNPQSYVAVRDTESGVAFSKGGIALGIPLPYNKMAIFWPHLQNSARATPSPAER